MYSILHCHFESALRALALVKPATVKRLRAVYSTRAYRRMQPATRLTFLWRNVMQLADSEALFDEMTFRRVVRGLCDEMTSSGVEHVDLRIGPSTGRWQWMRTAADGLSIFREELRTRTELSMTFLAGINMTKPREQLDAIFDSLLNDAGLANSITGVDINLLPDDLPKFRRYLRSLRQLQANGLKVNVHLGELFDNEVSLYILSQIMPNRIGHGVHLLHDRAIVEVIKYHGICVDMCPTSNTVLGVADWHKQAENPAARALRLGIPVSINTDDPVLFDTDISREFRLARLTPEQHHAILADSRKYRYGDS